MDFNKEQLEIINNLKGAFLVSAPVGTGKTTVLAHRVIKALEKGFKPEEILCLTFTNRAAEEMRDRIRSELKSKESFSALTIKTFHGFCASLIKEEDFLLDISPDFVIFEEEEQAETIRDVLSRHPSYPLAGQEASKRELMDLIEKIYKHRLRALENQIGCDLPADPVDETFKKIADDYARSLSDQNALDFNELVLIAIKAFYTEDKIRNKWLKRFKFIQLDEFQDTHLSEYLVVKELAKDSKNVAFIGDLDQTIYSFRGSEPYLIKRLIKSHFPDVKEMSLKVNYRFDPNILKAVKSFLKCFHRANTKEIESPHSASADEKCIDVFAGHNFTEEISWVIENIKNIKQQDPQARVAVLSRANWLIGKTAEIFEKQGVAHVTVDKYEFFRRQEVKDIFAYLKIIFNRFDLEAAYRLIKRPARNIGAQTIKDIRETGAKIGSKVSDFLNFRNYNYPEPFYDLINRWDKGRLIVLDTETTGTDPLSDQVIQIFAIEIVMESRAKNSIII
ncbi:AAA family ATPase [Candidatus Falkowbacteria bacterium]|nr:AAA family ATPase [Candidatus Falkowbacteria bacterium]